MSLAELVETTGLPRATAHRLAVALEAHRLLARDADGRFVLGPRLGELAAALPDPLVHAAQPVLAWVRDECGESAQLYRRDGGERVCVAAAERTHGLRTTVPVGTRLPLTAGSGAQVLVRLVATRRAPTVARRRAVHRADAGRGPPARLGAVGRASARPASRRCRRRCVSAPPARPVVVAAISISGPIERLGRAPGTRFAPVLLAGAARIAAGLAAG